MNEKGAAAGAAVPLLFSPAALFAPSVFVSGAGLLLGAVNVNPPAAAGAGVLAAASSFFVSCPGVAKEKPVVGVGAAAFPFSSIFTVPVAAPAAPAAGALSFAALSSGAERKRRRCCRTGGVAPNSPVPDGAALSGAAAAFVETAAAAAGVTDPVAPKRLPAAGVAGAAAEDAAGAAGTAPPGWPNVNGDVARVAAV